MNSTDIRGLLWRFAIQLTEERLPKLKELEEWQYLDSSAHDQLQQERITALLTHCEEHVPYYQQMLAELDWRNSDGNVEIGSFQDLPILTKDDIRNNSDRLHSLDLDERNWWTNTSGGSTGEPVEFIQDDEYRDWNFAVSTLFQSWTGYRIGEPRVKLWGSERDLFDERTPLKSRIGDWLRNETTLNAFRMGRNDMLDYIGVINEVKPRLITAYVESIYDLAEFVDQEGITVHSPNAIITTAGTLHKPVRKSIESNFDTNVFNRYGSREVGDIACECSHSDGLHVSSPTHFIEILDENGYPVESGEPGEVVVTSLTNYAMPLIRYKIGDIASLSEENCSCGRPWPLLSEVHGRISDVFITPDGTRVHGEFFTHLFYHEEWVHTFQVIQQAIDSLLIKLVLRGDQIPPEPKQEIIDQIAVVMGKKCEIKFEIVDEIDRTESGKYRYTISEVSAKWD